MKRRFVVFIFGVILALFPGTRLPAQDSSGLHTLSIAPFSGDKTTIPFWQTDMGQGLAEMLVESLESCSNTFQVLEMPDTTGQPAEPTSGGANSASDEKSSAKKSGKTGGGGSQKPASEDATNTAQTNAAPPTVADFTFYADVTEFTMKTNSSKIGDFFSSSKFGGLGGGLINAHIEIAWRIVDTGAHKVVKRGITVCSANGSELEMSSTAAASTPTAGVAKAAAVPQTAASTNKTMAMFNNFFGGIGKAFSSSSGSNGNGASASSGTTAASPRKAATSSADAGVVAAGSDSETYGYANPAFITSALGKASARAVTNIIEQLAAYQFPEPERIATLQNTPGKILAVVNNDTIIISLGSNQGFKAGDHLKLYETSDIKDDKGNVVFTDEKMVGELTLSEVQEDKSRGSYAGDSKVQQGWLVKAR